jgi:LPS-assembly lipoprotein
MTRLLTVTLSIIILFGLSACGFKLRGQVNFPPQIQTLYLDTNNPYGQFESSLRQTLRSYGVTLANSTAQPALTLKTSRPSVKTNNTTSGSSNEARVYNVTYSVTYSLHDNRGKAILPPQLASTTRSLTLNANQLLESNNQLTVLEREMQREVIGKMLNRLSSQQVAKLLEAY